MRKNYLYILLIVIVSMIASLFLLVTKVPDNENAKQKEVKQEYSEQIENEREYSEQIEVENEYIEQAEVEQKNRDIVLGNEQFDEYIPLLKDKRVALFTNNTGVIGGKKNGTHILDALLDKNVDIKVIFAPEHGFRGESDAGASVADGIDEKSGVLVRSLYFQGGNNSVSQNDLNMFDVLVVDIQDVGLRYYTYYISMYYLMNSCALNNKQFIILDRPNPNGSYVDGPLLKEGFHSGVGILPITVVHGMTLGELAVMINKEGWLSCGIDSLDLTVIKCHNYTHSNVSSVEINPSPNLKTNEAIYLYPSVCMFENTVISVGRGCDNPFTVYGCPYFKDSAKYSYEFVPESTTGAVYPQYNGRKCYGVDLSSLKSEDIIQNKINLDYLVNAYEDFRLLDNGIDFWGSKDGYGRYYIDLLMGTDEVRKMIVAGHSTNEIKQSWQNDIDAFSKIREKYLLYEN